MRCTKDCPKGTQCVKAAPTDEFGVCRSVDAGLMTDGVGQGDGGTASDAGAGGSGGGVDASTMGGSAGHGGALSGLGGTAASSQNPGGNTGLGGTANSGGGTITGPGGTPNPGAGTTSLGGAVKPGGTTSAGGVASGGIAGKGGTTSVGGITSTGGTSSVVGGTTRASNSSAPCTPNCVGKCSGDDGCNGQCSAPCTSPQTCGGGPQPNVCGCTPKCEGKCAGDDECGSTCPDNCEAPLTCAGNGTPGVCEKPPECTSASGTTWSQVAKSGTEPPAGCTYCKLVYDSDRDRIVYFNAVIWEWDPENNVWTSLLQTPRPPDAVGAGIAYDSKRGRVVIFGGAPAYGVSNETWEWDGTATQWFQRNPTIVPAPARSPLMAFDPVRNLTVMVTRNINEDATWEWDGSNWKERVAIGGGTPPALRSLEWDSVHKRIIGISEYSLAIAGSGDLTVWEWNPTSSKWTRLSYGCAPSLRNGGAVAYLAGKDQIIHFGGELTSGSNTQELWGWGPDGSSWRKYEQRLSWPGARWSASFAHDSKRNRLVMYHGSVLGPSDMWTLSIGP